MATRLALPPSPPDLPQLHRNVPVPLPPLPLRLLSPYPPLAFSPSSSDPLLSNSAAYRPGYFASKHGISLSAYATNLPLARSIPVQSHSGRTYTRRTTLHSRPLFFHTLRPSSQHAPHPGICDRRWRIIPSLVAHLAALARAFVTPSLPSALRHAACPRTLPEMNSTWTTSRT
ncbi:hypothetical protein GY45DRAFT_418928 [Cubamyces sp. BRFM 1775]|nr:hypothetical protein GY45DRAFT_418928 [Cubamyces sp. BRFM 1775]